MEVWSQPAQRHPSLSGPSHQQLSQKLMSCGGCEATGPPVTAPIAPCILQPGRIFPTARLGVSRSQVCDLEKPSLAVGKMQDDG